MNGRRTQPMFHRPFRWSLKMSRDIRRHHAERLKEKRRHYHSGHGKDDPRFSGIYAETPCVCSGYCCGNPRRQTGKLTVQERRHDDNNLDMALR